MAFWASGKGGDGTFSSQIPGLGQPVLPRVHSLGLLPSLFTTGGTVALCPQVSLAEIFDGNWVTSWLTPSTMLHIQITVLNSFLFYLVLISLNKTSAASWSEQIQKLFWVFLNQFSSVAQSYLTLCDPVNRSTPGLPVHHQLPEFTQTHVHWVGDAIQPCHPLSSPSPPALNHSQHQSLF